MQILTLVSRPQHHFLTLVILLLMAASASAQTFRSPDALFVPRGKTMLTLSTGIPFVGLSEYAYGFSDRFSLGVMIGQTPKVRGYGVRLRHILYERESHVRIAAEMPFLYYPKTSFGEPWVLMWPKLNAQWHIHDRLRLIAGLGVVYTECAEMLLTLGRQAEPIPHTDGHAHVGPREFMGDLWQTIQVGLSVPVSRHVAVQVETATVLDGLKLADSRWVGGPPVILTMSVAYTL